MSAGNEMVDTEVVEPQMITQLLTKSSTEMIRLAAAVREAKYREANTEMGTRMELIRVEHGIPDGIRYEIIDTNDPLVLAVTYAAPGPLALV